MLTGWFRMLAYKGVPPTLAPLHPIQIPLHLLLLRDFHRLPGCVHIQAFTHSAGKKIVCFFEFLKVIRRKKSHVILKIKYTKLHL